MLTDEKHCELLSAGIRHRSLSMQSNFRLFTQLFTGLVGGSVALRLQYGADMPSVFSHLADALAILITSTCAVLICDAFCAWYGYRRRLSEVAGNKPDGTAVIRPPRMTESAITLTIMFVVMVAALVGFVAFNPLRISS